MPQFLANSFLGLNFFFSVQVMYIYLNLIDLIKKNTFFFYLKLNLRPKNGLLEIAACNLEGPLIVLSSASRATYAIEIEGL